MGFQAPGPFRPPQAHRSVRLCELGKVACQVGTALSVHGAWCGLELLHPLHWTEGQWTNWVPNPALASTSGVMREPSVKD